MKTFLIETHLIKTQNLNHRFILITRYRNKFYTQPVKTFDPDNWKEIPAEQYLKHLRDSEEFQNLGTQTRSITLKSH